MVNNGNIAAHRSYTTNTDAEIGNRWELTNVKKVLKLALCFTCVTAATPLLANPAVKRTVIHSDQWKRHRAIEESIGRIQLDHLIASIVDGDGKRPLQSQRASRVTWTPAT